MLNVGVFAQDEAVADQNPIAPDAPPEDTGNLPIIESDPNTENAGAARVADEQISTLLLDSFEVPQGWIPSIPIDFGISKILYRDGSPQEIAGEMNKVVLGVKTVFFRRNYGWMGIDRPYPLSLKNYVRSFGIWISGRNKRHVFSVKIRDLANTRMRLSGGEMRFHGWKKVHVPVSDTVVQYDIPRDLRGLDFLGFHIDFVAEDTSTQGAYYMYLDQFTADMNMLPAYAPDDISDDW